MKPSQLELRCFGAWSARLNVGVCKVRVAFAGSDCVGLPTALSFAVEGAAKVIDLDVSEARLQGAIAEIRCEPLSIEELQEVGNDRRRPSDGAGRLVALHGPRVARQHHWNGGK